MTTFVDILVLRLYPYIYFLQFSNVVTYVTRRINYEIIANKNADITKPVRSKCVANDKLIEHYVNTLIGGDCCDDVAKFDSLDPRH